MSDAGLQIQVDTMAEIAAVREKQFERCRRQRSELAELLQECRDYFEERADAEYTTDRGLANPNEEMKLMVQIDLALSYLEDKVP